MRKFNHDKADRKDDALEDHRTSDLWFTKVSKFHIIPSDNSCPPLRNRVAGTVACSQ